MTAPAREPWTLTHDERDAVHHAVAQDADGFVMPAGGTVRVVEQILRDRLEPIRELADKWACGPDMPDYHVKRCPGCHRAARIRDALGEP